MYATARTAGVNSSIGEDEPAEEDRGQEQEQGQLDGLALRVRDDRDEQAEPERGDEEQADAPATIARVAEHRDAEGR